MIFVECGCFLRRVFIILFGIFIFFFDDIILFQLEESNGMLVLGSSLQVMTGYNIVRAAFVQSMPIVIVNIGATGADDLATMKIAAKCSDVVKEVHL